MVNKSSFFTYETLDKKVAVTYKILFLSGLDQRGQIDLRYAKKVFGYFKNWPFSLDRLLLIWPSKNKYQYLNDLRFSLLLIKKHKIRVKRSDE